MDSARRLSQSSQARELLETTETTTHTHTHTHTLALLPSVKRQVFCVGDRLKMVKNHAWATIIVVPKSVGSMTTKGQMKPIFRVSLMASQVRENSQRNVPVHTIVSSILTDLTFRRNLRTALSGAPLNQPGVFQTSKFIQYHHKLQHKFLILDLYV